MTDNNDAAQPRSRPQPLATAGPRAREDPAEEGAAVVSGASAAGVLRPQGPDQSLEPGLRTLADHLPDIIGRVDRQLRYVYINSVITDITRHSVADYLGRTDEELGHPPALCRLWRGQYEAAFATAEPSEIRFTFESPGGVMHFSKRVVPELAADGSIASLVFIARDVTALERARADRMSHRRVLAGINRIFETLVNGGSGAAFVAACRAEAEALTGSPWSCLHELGPGASPQRLVAGDAAGSARAPTGTPDAAPPYPERVMARICERVVTRGETLLIDDASVDQRDARMGEASDEPVPKAFLGVPLRHRDRVIGMIAVADRAGGYRQTERETLEALAPAIAEALALRKTEAALAAAKEEAELERKRLGAVLEASPAAVVLIDAATRRFTYLNRRAVELYGVDYSGKDLAAHAADVRTRRIDGSPYPTAEWPVNRTLASGEAVYQEELVLQRADAVSFPALVSSAPVFDPRGVLTSAVVLFDDISERKRAEAALRESEERLRIALEAAQFGTFEYCPKTDTMAWDDQLLRMWGLGPGEGLSWAQVVERLHDDDRAGVLAVVADAYDPDSGDDYQAEYRVIRPDGGVRWHATKGGVLFERDADGSRRPLRVAGVVRDVTEQKAAEAALVELNRALEARVAEVGRQADQLRALASQLSRVEQRERHRLAGILHDQIQQLIVAAQMQSATLLREAATERGRTAAGAVQEVLKEALGVCRSLTVQLSPPVLHETGLIGALDWLVGRMKEQHGFTVRLRTDTRAEPDAQELRFLFFECARELLLNVVKHAGVDAADLMLARPPGGALELVVSDAGTGFDADVVTRRRVDEASFGLFSIKERLAHLGGEMTILSAPERGTRVILRLPLAAGEREPAWVGSATGAQARADGLELHPMPDVQRVLIVDDHQIMRQGLAGLIRFEDDIEVVGEAAAGEEAVAMAAALRPDVILMDVNLGAGIDGIEATRRVLAAHPRVRVIGLSMHGDSSVADAMRDAGAAAYVTKGGPCEELLAVIRSCDAP